MGVNGQQNLQTQRHPQARNTPVRIPHLTGWTTIVCRRSPRSPAPGSPVSGPCPPAAPPSGPNYTGSRMRRAGPAWRVRPRPASVVSDVAPPQELGCALAGRTLRTADVCCPPKATPWGHGRAPPGMMGGKGDRRDRLSSRNRRRPRPRGPLLGCAAWRHQGHRWVPRRCRNSSTTSRGAGGVLCKSARLRCAMLAGAMPGPLSARCRRRPLRRGRFAQSRGPAPADPTAGASI